jgi:hypothetical protein
MSEFFNFQIRRCCHNRKLWVWLRVRLEAGRTMTTRTASTPGSSAATAHNAVTCIKTPGCWRAHRPTRAVRLRFALGQRCGGTLNGMNGTRIGAASGVRALGGSM